MKINFFTCFIVPNKLGLILEIKQIIPFGFAKLSTSTGSYASYPDSKFSFYQPSKHKNYLTVLNCYLAKTFSISQAK